MNKSTQLFLPGERLQIFQRSTTKDEKEMKVHTAQGISMHVSLIGS